MTNRRANMTRGGGRTGKAREPAHRARVLFALALTLVLGACSTPEDPTDSRLEPQFGTAENDFGVDAAYAAAGHVYVLSEQEGEVYNPDIEEDIIFENAYLRRYNSNGTLSWTREVASVSCDGADSYCDNGVQARTLVTDAGGASYVLVTTSGIVEDCSYEIVHRVHKYGAAGNLSLSIDLGSNGRPFGGTSTGAAYANVTDLAVDGGGNIYAVRQNANFDEDYCNANLTNVVAKYASSGGLQWQRLSSVGTLHGVSVSGNGNLYVAGSGGVAKYNSAGNLLWTRAGAANDVAAVGTNTVYARNNLTVRKLDASGAQLWSKAQSGLSGMVVGDMTTDASANVYLTGKYSVPGGNRDVFTRKLSAGAARRCLPKPSAPPRMTMLEGSPRVTAATSSSLARPKGRWYLTKAVRTTPTSAS